MKCPHSSREVKGFVFLPFKPQTCPPGLQASTSPSVGSAPSQTLQSSAKGSQATRTSAHPQGSAGSWHTVGVCV